METNTLSASSKDKPWYLKYLGLLIAGAVVLVVGLILFLVNNSVTNTGNAKESTLNGQYRSNKASLSDCLVKTHSAAGIATAQTDAFDKIITDAVKGRYGDGSGVDPTGGSLFSAIKEAYPDLTAVGDIYNKVLEVVVGCRSDYQSLQVKLESMIVDFDTWRTGSWTVRTFGGDYPDSNLFITEAGVKTTGMDALDKMRELVVVDEANDAYTSGTIPNDAPFPGNG